MKQSSIPMETIQQQQLLDTVQRSTEQSTISNVHSYFDSISNKVKADISGNLPTGTLCDLLHILTPSLFLEVPILTPVFQKSDNSAKITAVWDKKIINSIVKFEKKIRENTTIDNVHDIPLALFINVSSVGRNIEIISHSYLMFIMNVIEDKKEIRKAYTMGLGRNPKTSMITIRSPDFNPYVKLTNDASSFPCNSYNDSKHKFEGEYIIKAIEPLTIQYLLNFKRFLLNKITDVTLQKIKKKDIRMIKFTEKVFEIQTTIPYVMFNLLKGENCASFVEQMSYKKSINDISVSNKICGMNNPSSTIARYSNTDELNRFIIHVLNGDNRSVTWLLHLYHIFNNPDLLGEVNKCSGNSIV